MRISDWSSDVCSSDLMRVAARPDELARLQIALLRQHVQQQRIARDVEGQAKEDVAGTLVQLQAQPAVHHRCLKQAMAGRSEEHTSELQSLMRISYAVFCLKKKKTTTNTTRITNTYSNSRTEHTHDTTYMRQQTI